MIISMISEFVKSTQFTRKFSGRNVRTPSINQGVYKILNKHKLNYTSSYYESWIHEALEQNTGKKNYSFRDKKKDIKKSKRWMKKNIKN